MDVPHGSVQVLFGHQKQRSPRKFNFFIHETCSYSSMKSHPFMIHTSYFMDISDGFNAKNNELHFMDEIK
jgi:hypothetical protein